MSLDVYLRIPGAPPLTYTRIFIRENGQILEISREEWDRRYPGREPATATTAHDEVYSANITHNLGGMAREAGIYQHLWRPEEIGVTKAKQLIEPLAQGLTLLKSDPERFKKHNPPNGWGSYDRFIPWIEEYLAACIMNPDADVEVSR